MIRWFAAHPTAANLLLVLLIAAGVLAAPGLQRETFPDFQPREVSVEVVYRGATAADVEDAVCRRLIEALEMVEQVAELTCTARDSLARATVEMTDGGDFARLLDDIDTEVGAIDDLPERAEAPVIRERHRTDLVAAVAVTGPMPPGHLKDYAETLQDRLLRLPGVARVDLRGFSQRQLQVRIPRAVLRQHGLSAGELARRIAEQNVDLPGGTLETRERDVLLRFTDERRSAAALAELVVLAGEGGGELRLGDIARIRDGFEHAEERIHFNGGRAAVLEVSKARAEDALDVLARLRELIAAERARVPEGLTLTLTQDNTTIVRDRLRMLLENGVLGLLLVLAVMSAFFRPRFALWAAMGLPVALLGATLAMSLLGLSLNMITLVALLMAVGIVMDDSIVITDSIVAQIARQGSALDAAVAGTRQVLPGVLSSFLTTLAVFTPLAFLAGEVGAVLEVLPVVLIAALAASLVEAFLILPHHLRHAVERLHAAGAGRWRAAFERGFDWTRERIVGAAADRAIRWRYAVAGLLALALLGSAGYVAGGHIGREAIPEIDGDLLEARLLLPKGTPLARTEAVVERTLAALRDLDRSLTPEQPGGRPLVESVQVRYSHNPSADETGPHVATVMVDLLAAETRSTRLDPFIAGWRERIGAVPGLVDLVIREPGIGPQGIPIEVRLQGEDLDTLKAAALELRAWLAGYAATYNVFDDLRPGAPEVRLRLADGARSLGLTAEAVAAELRAAFLGQVASEVRVGDRSYEIEVRQRTADRRSLDDLAEFTVNLPDGTAVPLSAVAEIEHGRGWAKIPRIGGVRTVTVQSDVDGRIGNAEAIVDHTRAHFLPQLAERFPEVGVAFEGETARTQETAASIQRAFAAGLLGIFVVLAYQFRSYVEPLIVMAVIPLALLGALWGHVAMGYNISMPSLVGAASLAGIIVNNAILLVHFIKGHVAAGMDVLAAAGQASRDRFRAILVSSSTTVAGLLPLLAETSPQAQVLKPLVISVGFGLLAGTVLVLLAIPALYGILADLGRARLAAAPAAH